MATNTIICGLDTLEGRKFFRQSLFRLYSKWETLNEETSQMEQDITIEGAYINCTSLNDLKDNILYKILCDDNNLGLTDNKGAFSMYRSYSGYEISIVYIPNKIKITNRCLKSFLTDVKEDEVIMNFEGQNAAKFRISFGRIENDGYGNREIVWDNPIYFNDGTNNSNAELLQLIAKKENNYEVAVKIELNNGVKKIIKASELTKIEIVEYEHNYGDDFYFIGWDENKREFTSGAAILNDILNFIDLNNPDEQREFQPGEVNFIGSAFRIEAETGSSYDVEETIPIQFFQPYKWGRQSYFVENLEILPGDLAVVFWEKDLNQYVYLEQGDNEKFGYVCFGPSGSPKIETIHCIGHYDHLNFYLTPDENKTKPLMFLSREQEASGGWYAIYNNPYTIGLIDYFANNPILDDSLQNFILQKNQEKNIYSLNDYFKFVSLEDKSYAESNEEIVFGYIPKIMVGAGTTIDILTEPQPYYFLSDPSWKDKKGSIIYAPEKIKPTGTTHYLRLPFLINNHFNVVNLVHHIINNKTPKTIWSVTVQKDTTVNKYDAKWTVLNENETETIETEANIIASDKAFNRIKIGTLLEITNITYANDYSGTLSRNIYSNYDGATVLLRGNLVSWTASYTIDSTTIKRVNYQILDSNNNVVQSGYTYDNSLHIPNVNYKVRLIGVPKDNTSYIEYSNPTVITINNNSPSPEIKANKKEFFFFSTKLKVNGEEKPSGVSDIKFTLKKGTTTLEENRQTISNCRIEKNSNINYTLETTTSKFYEDVTDQTFNGNQNQNFILEVLATEKPVSKIIWSFDPFAKKLTFRKEVPNSFPTLNYTVASEYLGTPKAITTSDVSYTIQVNPQDTITLTFNRPATGIYPEFEETISFSASRESQGVQKDDKVLSTGYDLTITTKKERIFWWGGGWTDYYDNFYYKINDDATYTAITSPVTNQVIPNVIMVSFYYDLAEPSPGSGGYHTITGDYTKIGDYYRLDGPLSITFQSSYPCFVKGTKITLADRTYKNVEDITYEDELLVWDFDKGEFTSAKPIWILKPQKALAYNKLVFSDGSELRTVNQHRIFNAEEDKFTYPMTDDTPIGTTTFNDKGELITLVSKEVVEEEVEYYNIITDYHINLFASSILTSCRLSNLYPIKDMKYIKDDRELHSPEIFNEVSPKWVRGLRLLEQPLEVNRENAVKFDNSLVDYVKRLESTKL